MKKNFFLVVALLFTSCAGWYSNNPTEQSYNAEFRKKEFFEEWGFFRYTGINILSKNENTPNEDELKNICKDVIKFESQVARLYEDKLNNGISIECFFFENTRAKTMRTMEFLLSIMTEALFIKVKKEDSLYKVLYEGDSIPLVSGNFINHKKVCEDTLTKKCSIDEDDVLYPKYVERIYEVDFPVGLPVISTTIRTKEKNLRGFKPLKLDPSLLPLESPGYKALREQEEAMNKE